MDSHEIPDIDRRGFLAASLGAFLACTHAPLVFGRHCMRGVWGVRGVRGDQPVRFAEIHLRTTALKAMSKFYAEKIKLTLDAETDSGITLRAGRSIVAFKSESGGDADAGGAMYHFAFNIPENMIRKARAWLMEQDVEILTAPAHLRDPAYPDDVVHFRHWDAHSLFFWDPAGNMVEFIARHTMKNASNTAFDESQILGVSELAFVVDDVKPTAQTLSGKTDLDLYGAASEQFAAVGDEHGLLLVFKTGRKLGFGAGPGLKAHPAEAVLREPLDAPIGIGDLPYTIRGQAAPNTRNTD